MLNSVLELKRFCRSVGIAAVFVTCSVSAEAPADIRVALVIGNAAYPGSAALANPVNDARAMADTLKHLGFTVVELHDGVKSEMSGAIAKVRETLRGKRGVGMLYYAGHGLQLDWHNYIVPVDANMVSASDVQVQAIDVNTVLDAFRVAGTRTNIVVLDACRDNPFASTGSGKGLAQQDAPPSTFFAYATAPGNVAEDGDTNASGNGLYTQYLLEEIKKPTARIEDVFKRVRLNVRKQSQGRQIPWESTSLEEDFHFNREGVIQKLSTVEDELLYKDELSGWDAVMYSESSDALIEYLKKYPDGRFSQPAQFRLDQIAKPKLTAQAKPGSHFVGAGHFSTWQIGDIKEVRVNTYDSGGRGSFSYVNRFEVLNIDDDSVLQSTNFNSSGMLMNGRLTLDLMGNPVRGNTQVSYGNPGQAVPSEYKIGLNWKFSDRRSFGDNDPVEYQARIVAREKLKVPAGEFETYRVEMKGVRRNGTELFTQAWVVPGALGIVKSKEVRTGKDGRIYWDEKTELLSYKASL